ncbi:MAG: ADP-ribosylation factor-like protein, partial [Promethearchaeia archaeon]
MVKDYSTKKAKKKIVVMGLDNSGKTSIVLNLMDRVNLLNYLSLKPTAGVEVKDFETDNKIFNIWDLGGQKTYRKDYLQNIDKYMSGMDKLIYVIDVQDVERYSNALDFLEKNINLIQEKNYKPELNIFIHKYDLKLFQVCPELNKEIINELVKDIKNIIPEQFFYHIYRTTIYTTFDKRY